MRELEDAAQAILEEVPLDPNARSPRLLSFSPSASPRCAAVDGGSTVVLNVRTAGVYAIRAGYVVRDPADHSLNRVTTRLSRTATRRGFSSAWEDIRRHYAPGLELEAPRVDGGRVVPQLAEAERDLAEYDAARRALHELRRGDLLLLDGCLDDEHKLPLRASLLEWAAASGVAVIALSKDTSLSIHGILPMTLELEEVAVRQKASPPWFVDATAEVGRADAPYRILAAQFDPRAPPFRVDVAGVEPARAVSWAASLCNDPAYPGYPYPLARVHERVHFESGEALDLRRELEGIVARRRGHRLSARLFGQGRDVLKLAS